jgi:hypothetical protein
MRTIGRHIRLGHPLGDYETMCSICGQHYVRSDLTRNGDGQLVCRDDEGSTARELDEDNREAMPKPRGPTAMVGDDL